MDDGLFCSRCGKFIEQVLAYQYNVKPISYHMYIYVSVVSSKRFFFNVAYRPGYIYRHRMLMNARNA